MLRNISGLSKRSISSFRSFKEHPNVENNTVEELSDFPFTKLNTVFNIGRQGYLYVIERFGKFNRIMQPGIFFTIPIFEKIYKIDIRQKVIDIARQNAYTSDNVAVSVAAQLYIRVINAEATCYQVTEPLVAVVSQAQSALRTAIGKCDLDHLLKDRNTINICVREALLHSVEQWGIDVLRFEITELTPDTRIQQAMDLQSIAERERRAMVATAEGKRQAMETEALGKKISLRLEAEGKKDAVELEAQAVQNASKMLENSSDKVLNYWMGNLHIKMVGDLAKSANNNTFFVNKDISMLPALGEIFRKKE